LFTLDDVSGLNTIIDVKKKIYQQSKPLNFEFKKFSLKFKISSIESLYYPERQQIKADPSKSLI
jgi:hypothetical protein